MKKPFILALFLVFILRSYSQSDNCSNATLLTINSLCTFSNGTTLGATQSLAGCSGNADDDVWYRFVANSSLIHVLVQSSPQFDAVFQVYSGTCSALMPMICKDELGIGQNEELNLTGLTIGQTYYLRVYDYLPQNAGNFSLCLYGETTTVPSNDEPCAALMLPEVNTTCAYGVFTNVGAAASVNAPNPYLCAEGSSPQLGGFSASSKDVWFNIVVPETGNIHITSKPNAGAGSISDVVMAIYSGACNTLTQIACSDDHSAYPGIPNDLLPQLSLTNLVPGDTLFLRVWGFGSLAGTFGLCITTTTNDECANALYICDINGYSATTSAAYSADRPGNMQGNNEDNNGVNMPDGINTGGVFGQAGPWGTGASGFNVTINNNSWIRFTAAAATALLNVTVYDCWIGNYPSGGLQMQIFSGENCSSFIPVSDFKENSTGFTLTANNLVIGADYYLMVDGFAGDICAYTITAESGVLFSDIVDSPPICPGDSLLLTGPIGASSYLWQTGETSQSISVQPSVTQSYTCEVTGLCDFKQILETTVTVKPLPEVAILNGDSLQICLGDSILLMAAGAAVYHWSSGPDADSWFVFPISDENFTVSAETGGCVNKDSINIHVNTPPELDISLGENSSKHCENTPLTLSASGAMAYTWLLPDGSTVQTAYVNISQFQSTDAGTYQLLGYDFFGCHSMDSILLEIVLLPEASIELNDAVLCLDEDITLYSNSNVSSNTTNSWFGPNGNASDANFLQLNNVTFEDIGWYFLTVTDTNGCVHRDSSYILIENSSDCFLIPEVVTPNNDGKNDVWHIQGLDPTMSHSIEIYNRWGNQIFNKTDFENNWDCRSNCGIIIDEKNGLVPTGTYFYILKTGGPNGASYTGSLEIHY
jgi:gliding motility-associated-like protein